MRTAYQPYTLSSGILYIKEGFDYNAKLVTRNFRNSMHRNTNVDVARATLHTIDITHGTVLLLVLVWNVHVSTIWRV